MAIGIRTGLSVFDRHRENFEESEVFLTYGLPWFLTGDSGWFLSPRLNATAGFLRESGERGFLGGLGPEFVFGNKKWRMSLGVGTSAVLLSKGEFERLNLGGELQFVSHVTLMFDAGRNINIGYRLQHMSNAGIQSQNPGLEVITFELSYVF